MSPTTPTTPTSTTDPARRKTAPKPGSSKSGVPRKGASKPGKPGAKVIDRSASDRARAEALARLNAPTTSTPAATPTPTAKPARPAERGAKTGAKPAPKGTPKRAPRDGQAMSALDAAAAVLKAAKRPMDCKAIVEAMAKRGLWESKRGKTPAATIYSAMAREIEKRGKDARFKKAGKGMFEARG